MVYDYLIVGQGIAGTLVAHQLLQRQKQLLVVDAAHTEAASRVAAGILNPITGRHFVKSWRVDDLWPVAWQTYHNLEQLLGIEVLEERLLTRFLPTVKAHNDWLVRSGHPDLQAYLRPDFDAAYYGSFLQNFEAGVEFQQTGRAKLAQLTAAFRQHLRQAATLIEAAFAYEQLDIRPDGVVYQGHHARRVIFAEGYRMQDNPHFNYLPLTPAKGDVLLVRIPGYPASDRMIKHGVFMVPWLSEDLYWIGSTYNHHYQETAPQPADRAILEQRLSHALQLPFEVVEHQAAVRPAVRDRRPLLGQHPHHPALYVFNGLGAKGASLGPFWAQALVAHLENQRPLDPSVDIARFDRFYTTGQA